MSQREKVEQKQGQLVTEVKPLFLAGGVINSGPERKDAGKADCSLVQIQNNGPLQGTKRPRGDSERA